MPTLQHAEGDTFSGIVGAGRVALTWQELMSLCARARSCMPGSWLIACRERVRMGDM